MNDWIEVFKTGTHTDSAGNVKTWGESDLDKIAKTYNPARHEAPIVIGHPRDNSPAWGWVNEIKKTGGSLFAKFKDVVPEFADLVKTGMFKKRSISLYPDLSLRHIGFLGGMPPAVKGLEDVKFSEDENATTIEFEETEKPGQEPEKNKGGNNMDENVTQLQEKLAEKDKTLGEYAEKLKTAEDELKSINKELENLKAESRKAESEAFCEKLINEGKILPVQKPAVISLMEIAHSAGDYDFSEGKKSVVEVFKSFMESLSKQINLSEVATKDKAGKSPVQSTGAEFGENVDPERLSIHNRALEIVSQNKVPYEVAVTMAGKE